MKTKIFPLKLSDSTYSDLRLVSQYENLPMSRVIKNYFADHVESQAKKIRKEQADTTLPMTLLDSARELSYSEKNTTANSTINKKSDDELLYGDTNK